MAMWNAWRGCKKCRKIWDASKSFQVFLYAKCKLLVEFCFFYKVQLKVDRIFKQTTLK